MPPSNRSSSRKKKKAKVHVDFKKVKHKVGRKLPPATNVTKLDVKSKTIVLPGQSVAQEKDGLPVNSRRQTLKDLLMQTTHHNDNIRKEALIGIKDLINRHPKELRLHAVAIIEQLAPRMTDYDKGVRQNFLLLMGSTIFPGLPEVVMGPLVPIMMAYLCSAMTHLTMDIHLSAFSFFDLLIQFYPSLILAHYTDQTIQHYVGFLGKVGVLGEFGNRLLDVLKSLVQFLTALQLRGLTADLDQDNGHENFALHSYKSALRECEYFCGVSLGEGLMNEKEKMFLSLRNGRGRLSTPLSDSLIYALLNCWGECAPSVFSGQAPDGNNLDCLVSISRALHIILQCIRPDVADSGTPSNEWYTQDLHKKSKYPVFKGGIVDLPKSLQEHSLQKLCCSLLSAFPICAPVVSLPKKLEEGLIAINVGICQVVLVALTVGDGKFDIEDFKLSSLLRYIEGALHGKMLPASRFSSSGRGKKLVEHYVKSLLQFIPGLSISVNEEWQIRLLQAFTGVFQTCKANSRLKLTCLNSILEMLLLSGQSCSGSLTKEVPSVCLELQKQWLQALPRLLWELKHHHPSSSLAVLQVLHCLGQSAPDESTLCKEYTELQPSLVPFFCTFNPSKHHQARWLYGPFVRLPVRCQELAIDSLYYHRSFSKTFLRAIVKCFLCPSVKGGVIVRGIEVLQRAFCRGAIKLQEHISFLFTLLASTPPEEKKLQDGPTAQGSDYEKNPNITPEFQRQRVISSVVCSCLAQIGDGRVILGLMDPLIGQQLALNLPLDVSYGLIKLVTVLSCTRKGLYLTESLAKYLPQFVANHFASAALMECLQGNGRSISIEQYIQPALTLLSKSKELTGLVVNCLCSSLSEDQQYSDEKNHTHSAGAALLKILKQNHVCQQFSSNTAIADSVLKILKVESIFFNV
eukprot:c28551_g1_i1 orf=248-2986(+)